MKTLTRPDGAISASVVVASIVVLWPYAFHELNWYGKTMWDGIVALLSGALEGKSAPAWFYLMIALPILSLVSGLIAFLPSRISGFARSISVAACSVQFPFGTFAGAFSLIIINYSQKKKRDNKAEMATPRKPSD